MNDNQPTSPKPPPSGQGVMIYTLDRAGNLTPVTRIEKHADGPWHVFSGLDSAPSCLEPLEEAHACCLIHSMAATAAAAIAGMEKRALKPTEGEA
ncbi:hypothetical protein [Prosthecobacter sp.]|uniref:hypothetical protein n=1 Tax=Prosthecobacter sp. TaxID=1965333 RepID=UPI00378358A0